MSEKCERRLRIVFLNWRDTTHPEGGGAELFVERVAAELAARGHHVTIRCASHTGASGTVERDGITFSHAGGRLSVYPRALAWLLGPGRRADVVVDAINGVPFGSPLVRRRGVVALVHHVHREQWRIIYPGLLGALGWALEGRVVPRLYRGLRFLTVSQATRAELAALGVDPALIRVARNGVDLPPPTTRVKSATPRLAVCSRLVPHKQIEHALAVVDALRDVPGIGLDIIGSGWWEQQLRERSSELGLDGIVRFVGHVPDAERDDLLASAWLHLLPSVMEGWGLSIVEAGAVGTPTLAYASAGGVRESVVHGQSGWLVDDLAGLIRHTARLLDDAEARETLGRGARAHAARHSWAACADTVERTLLECR